MTVSELIERLETFPANAQVSFLCPDGYEDSVDDMEMDGENLSMGGYVFWAAEERRKERMRLADG